METNQERVDEAAADEKELLNWTDLQQGDRVYHFDYGIGTVDGAGPLWLLITWDNPGEHLDCHGSEMARHLIRVPPSGSTGSETDVD